jgi:hypothetical protein
MQILLDHSTETIKTFTDLSTKGCMCVYTHHVVGLFEHQLLKISSYKAQIIHWPSRNTCLIWKMCCPVKFAHSLPKKCRNISNWELCVICQINTPDILFCATEKGRDTLFSAGKVLERIFIVDTEASLLVLLHSGTSLTNRCQFLLLV